MSTQAAVSGQATKNRGGTIKKAGSANTTTGPITKSRTLMDDAVTTNYGAKVALSSGAAYSSGNVGTFAALTSGTFAYNMVAGRYIMKKRTHYVNGTASTLLTSCASSSAENAKNPAVLETSRTLGSGVTTSFDVITGTLTKGGNYGGLSTYHNINSETYVDSGARPTNAIPGEIAYKTGAKLPIADDYQPRTAP